MKAFSSREIIKILQDDGWFLLEVRGDHHHFKHPTKRGKIAVLHPKKNLPIKTVKSILKQAGIEID